MPDPDPTPVSAPPADRIGLVRVIDAALPGHEWHLSAHLRGDPTRGAFALSGPPRPAGGTAMDARARDPRRLPIDAVDHDPWYHPAAGEGPGIQRPVRIAAAILAALALALAVLGWLSWGGLA